MPRHSGHEQTGRRAPRKEKDTHGKERRDKIKHRYSYKNPFNRIHGYIFAQDANSSLTPKEKNILSLSLICSSIFSDKRGVGSDLMEILKDLSSGTPMDRLICGDVGFGKTEIALRASLIVSNDGYQVAILAPTTLLARQHYETFKNRFKEFPNFIEKLTRFENFKMRKEIVDQLKNGQIDIIIGTHALLSSEI